MDDLENALTRYFRETGENLSILASRMGRAPSTLTRPVNGERNPSISLAREVEQATGGRVGAAAFIEICMSARSAPAQETAA
jgi:transcriptional regulator with XRE-family HTH domain